MTVTARNRAPIGVFDSGIGGLTVARAIYERLPHESTIYFGDTARVPYGPKSPETVRRYSLEILHWLLGQGVKAVVVACNTSTAHALDALRAASPVSVVGVIEPGARAAVKTTRNRHVGVIATVGTVESGAYSRAVRALDAGVTVFSVATPKFVDVVEAGLRMGPGQLEDTLAEVSDVFIRPSFYEMARDYLDPLKRSGIELLGVFCTPKDRRIEVAPDMHAKFVIFGDSDFVSNTYLGVAGNANLFLNAVNWLCGEGALISCLPTMRRC